MVISRRLVLTCAAVVMLASLAAPSGAGAETVLRAVMHSDLKIVDPIWTTAYIARNHGYMIYDTLLAMNENQEPTPQMLEKWEVSGDKLVYTFSLRDGLKWHDGTPVRSELAEAMHRAVQKIVHTGADIKGPLDEAAAEVDRATAEFKKS